MFKLYTCLRSVLIAITAIPGIFPGKKAVLKPVAAGKKHHRNYYRLLPLILLFAGLSGGLNAATYYTRATGNWNATATWSTAACSGAAAAAVPGTGDDVIICTGHTITLNTTGSIASLSLTGGTLNFGANTLTVGSLSGTGNVTITTGTLNIGTGSIFVYGNFAYNGGTFTATGTGANVIMNGTGNKTIGGTVASMTIYKLQILATGTKTMTNNITVSNQLVLFAGTLAIADKTLSIPYATSTSVTQSGGSGTLTLNAAATYSSLTITGGATAIADLRTTLFISNAYPLNFNNYSITNSANSAISGSMNVAGTFAMSGNGDFNIGTNTLTITGNASRGAGDIISSATGTVNFNAPAATQSVIGGVFGNLTFSNFNKSLLSTYTYQVAGTFTPGTATGHTVSGTTFIFNGTTGAQTIPAFNGTTGYNSLQLNNTSGATASGGPVILGTSGVFTLTNGILTTSSANYLLLNNTAVAAFVGGTSANYIKGPLRRAFLNASGNTYAFPVGATNFQDFDLTFTVAPGATGIFQAEAVDGAPPPPAAAGANLNGLGTKYWVLTPISGGNIQANGATVKLTDSGLSSTSRIGLSNTLTGSYANIGGTVAAGAITSSTFSGPGSAYYFVIGTPVNLSGPYTVGNSGNFLNLTAIAQALRVGYVTGNVTFELQSDYDALTESWPVVFNAYSASGSYNVVVGIASGITSIASEGTPASGNPLIDLNGISNITFDGRPGQTGTMSNIAWTFRNKQTAATFGATFRFINGASNIGLKYLNIESQNANTTSGTIEFSTSTAAAGNANNTIEYSHIRDRSDVSGFPTHAIYSSGTSAKVNLSNTISNNYIYNYWTTAAVSSRGIYIPAIGFTSDWTISGNHFYQTAARTSSAATTSIGIDIQNTAGVNFTISGNYFGGSAPSAGSTALTITGTNQKAFVGINLSLGTSTASTIENNVIRNINVTNPTTISSLPGMFSGIYLIGGLATISGNTIGSNTVNAGVSPSVSLSIGSGATNMVAYGIVSNGSSAASVTGNFIGGVLMQSTAVSASFTGILANSSSSAARTVTGNLIGSLTSSNSIFLNTGSTSTGNAQALGGITLAAGSSTVAAVNVSGNTIANLVSDYTGTLTSSQVTGISVTGTSGPVLTISGNEIYSLENKAAGSGTGLTASVLGIVTSATSVNGAFTIGNNLVHSLSNTNTTSVANQVSGIWTNTTTTTANTISKNFVHSLSLSSSNTGASIVGIGISAGSGTTTSNNMIRLGINAAGSSITTGYAITGIQEAAAAVTNHHYFNSVYIGGSSVSASSSLSYAFNSSSTSTTARNIQDNIFFNARSNAAGGGAKHYAMRVANITNLTSNYNDLFSNGTDGSTVALAAADYPTLGAWKAFSGNDLNSVSGDPEFISPAGNASAVDLHIQPPPVTTPVEQTGLAIGTITDDYDGIARSGLTPTDIGADAGNFAPVDLTPPNITDPVVAAQCNTATSFTVNVVITDASGINTTSGTKPRFYYKKSTDANTYAGNTSGDNGWKWVEATNTSSPFSFTVDFTKLTGGGVALGNSIEYFIVAQDIGPAVFSPNVGIVSGASFAATPSDVNLTTAAFPVSNPDVFAIAPCSGTVTVGPGGNYTTFTRADGIFNAINAATLSGNLVINVIGDISTENGAVALNQWAESGAGNYTVTIQPDATTLRTISGAYNGAAIASNGLFRFFGADRVTINGGSGSNRYLTFRNTSVLVNFNSVMHFYNDAKDNTVTNCTLEGGSSSGNNAIGVIYIGTGSAGGNDNITINNNFIRDLTTATSYPSNGIFAFGAASPNTNDGLVISNNSIINFYNASTRFAGINIDGNNVGVTIQNNDIYQTVTRNSTLASDHYGIIFHLNSGGAAGNAHLVTGNRIGGDSRVSGNISGNWTETGSTVGNRFYGIWMTAGTTTVSRIESNIISGIVFRTTSGGNISSNGGAFTGINVAAGKVDVGAAAGSGNIIGAASGTGAITITLYGTPSVSVGIVSYPTSSIVNTYHNTIGAIEVNTNTTTYVNSFYGVYYNSGFSTVNVSNNTVTNINCNSAGNAQYLMGLRIVVAAGAIANINDNIVSNLYSGGSTSSSTGQVIGISASSTGIFSINRNLIFSLSYDANNTSVTTSQAVIGIFYSGSSSGQLISKNTIHSLKHTGTTQTVGITGIFFSGSTNTAHVIERNFIHSFDMVSNSAAAVQFGIYLDGSSGGAVQNNMIRLGIKPDGTSVPNSNLITGIYDGTTTANQFYFNTVFIGGTSGSATVANTYAFRRNTTGADNIRNNIFANGRTGGSTSVHYALASNATTTGVIMDYNILYTSGASTISFNNGTSAATGATQLHALRAAISTQNLNSAITNTLSTIGFVSATGNAASVDLHLNDNNAAAGAGVAITGILSDIDDDGLTIQRSAPPAIGAHESSTFNPVSAGNDVFTPVITVAAISSPQPLCPSGIAIPVTATVTDFGAGVATGSVAPTLWWKLLTAPTWNATLPSSSAGSTYSFTLSIPSPLASETYQYYVAAQDLATVTNIWYSTYNAASPLHTPNVSSAPSISNAVPATFTIGTGAPLSGVVTVGTPGGNYATLNGPSGLFADINSRGLGGNLTAEIISNITETVTTPLNSVISCAGPWNVKITPSTTTLRTITGNLASGIISLNGADNVTIDGSAGTTSRYLAFVNTSTSGAVITFNNDARNDTVRYSTLRGAATVDPSGIIVIGTTGSIGNSNIMIANNQIGNSASRVFNCVYANGALNSNNTITANEIFNFIDGGVMITPAAGPNWTISDNIIYDNLGTCTTRQFPVYLDGRLTSHSNVISGNLIGGTTNTNTGTWVNSSDEFWGIYCYAAGTSISSGASVIKSNTFKNFRMLGGYNYQDFRGIYTSGFSARQTFDAAYGYYIIGGDNDADGNIIGDAANPNSIQLEDEGNGVYDDPTYYGIVNETQQEAIIKNNKVYSLYTPGSFEVSIGIASGVQIQSSLYNGLYVYAGKSTIAKNTVMNMKSNSVLRYNYYAQGSMVGISLMTLDNNSLVENNKVSAIYSLGANATLQTAIIGIGIDGLDDGAGGGIVRNNIVTDIKNTNGGIGKSCFAIGMSNGKAGLFMGSDFYGSFTFVNNMVNLSTNTTALGNDLFVFGIFDMTAGSTTQKYFNNTLLVGGGNVSGGTNYSMTFWSFPDFGLGAGAPNLTLRNNILINSRTGGGNHRAISVQGWGGGSSDYNFFGTLNTSKAGQWITTEYTFNNWKIQSGGDSHSLYAQVVTGASPSVYNTDPTIAKINADAGHLFIDPSDIVTPGEFLHIDITDGISSLFITATGTDLSSQGVTADIDGDDRTYTTTPNIGADEFISCIIPVVTVNPADDIICSGAPASFTVAATGTVTLNYQWQVSTDGGLTYSNLSNAGVYSDVTTTTLAISSSTGLGNNKYRAVVTNICGIDTSAAATLTIQTSPVLTSLSPPSFVNSICALSNTGFGVVAYTGTVTAWQWQLSTDNGASWNNLSNGPVYGGTTAQNMTISNTPASLNGYQYRVIATGPCAPPDTSIAGVLNVGSVAIGTQPPATTTVCENGNTSVTVAATGNNLTFQWHLSTNGGATYTPLSNGGVYSDVTTQTLVITGATLAMNNYRYRVVVGTTACSPLTSTHSLLIVNPQVTPTASVAAAPATTICAGTNVTFTATIGNGGGTPAYQWYLNGNPVGSNADTYANNGLSDDDEVYVSLTSSATCPSPATVSSNTVVMTVNPVLTPSVSIAAAPGISVCVATPVTFTATPVNGGGTPAYQWYLNGNPVGLNQDTYTNNALVNGDQVTVEMTTSVPCPSTPMATSNTATMTIRFAGQWIGNTSDWNTPSNWGCGGVPLITTDVVVPTLPEGGFFPLVTSNATAFCHHLQLQVGAVLTVDPTYDLAVYGNITNNGTPSFGGGLVKLSGSAQQTVAGTAVTQFGALTLDNSTASTALLLSQDIAVNGLLTISDGIVDLNGKFIDLGTTGTLTGETETDRITGVAGEIRATRTLAASTPYTDLAGLGIDITTSPVAPGVTTLERGHQSYQQLGIYNAIERYWRITPVTDINLDATAKFHYFNAEVVAGSESEFIPWKSDDNGSSWEGQFFPANLSNSPAANWVQQQHIGSFSLWTISDWETEPLPIELLSFDAVENGSRVDLQWVTASEINNDFFTVERSADAIHFEHVFSLPGAGNSSLSNTYSGIDPKPLNGLSYYRLKQTDFDGNFSFSHIVPVMMHAQLNFANVFVNADNNFNLDIASERGENVSVEVFDFTGKLIINEQVVTSKGHNNYTINNSGLATGIYLVRVRGKEDEFSRKVFVR